MRHLVWSRADITSQTGLISLPVPQPSEEDWRDYRDIMVLAFPTPEGDIDAQLMPETIKSNISCDWKSYLAGHAQEALHLKPSTPDNR